MVNHMTPAQMETARRLVMALSDRQPVKLNGTPRRYAVAQGVTAEQIDQAVTDAFRAVFSKNGGAA